MTATVDATKIHFSAKGIAYLFVAIVVLIVLYMIAQNLVVPWLQRKVPGVAAATTGAGSGSADPSNAGL